MIAFPPCKINLGLNVTRKREDGYHDIVTCFYPVPWTDILEVIPSETSGFTSSGNAIPGNATDNLCLKAYHLIKHEFSLSPVQIHLHKVIPTGAGLGGGSSDGAFTLRLLNKMFNLELSVSRLQELASQLGSDCAFFCQDEPCVGRGRGNELSPISFSLKGKFIVLVKPSLHISTAEAYSGVIVTDPAQDITDVVTRPITEWKDKLVNDFETGIFKLYPQLKKIKDELYASGAIYASMSGSGSSLFGLFETNVQLDEKFPRCQIWSGQLTH